MAESMAFFAPNVNSYRRFQPDMFAPVNRHWGVNNRSAGLRIPMGPSEARRVEHRCAGADANPYYALAAVLAGIHFGLEKQIDPGAPAMGNVSRDPDAALPFTIDAALARLGEARALATISAPKRSPSIANPSASRRNACARSSPKQSMSGICEDRYGRLP